MVPGKTEPGDHRGQDRVRDGKKEAGSTTKKRLASRKKGNGSGVPRPEDLPGEVQCSYPGWQGLLDRYPMIHSLQREDFMDHGVSFVYVAHLYCTKDHVKESSRSHEEFEHFFKDIGYEYEYSGNFESRWFEGIGVKFE